MRDCLPIMWMCFLPSCFFCMRPLVALLPGNLQFHCALQAPHASVRRVQGRLRCIAERSMAILQFFGHICNDEPHEFATSPVTNCIFRISCNIALLPILRLIESSAFQFNLYLFCRIWGQHKYALLRCGGAYWWRQHREFAASLMPHCISCISCDLQSGERCLHKAVLLLAKSWVFCILRLLFLDFLPYCFFCMRRRCSRRTRLIRLLQRPFKGLIMAS